MNDDLTDSLADAFGTLDAEIAPASDWDDLSSRIEARHRRHRRGLTGCAALVAVLTGAGGFLVGHNTDSSMTLSPGGATRTATNKEGVVKPASSGSDDVASTTMVGNAMSNPVITSSTGFANNGIVQPGVTRTAAGGVQLRSWKQIFQDQSGMANEYLPGACIYVGNLAIAAVTDDDAASFYVNLSQSTTSVATLQASTGMSGKYVLLASVTSVDAAKISVRFPNGETDSMTPVNGLALFAIKADATELGKWKSTKLTATAADGTTTDLSVDGSSIPYLIDPYAASSVVPTSPIDCSPVLPAPGEQPKEPAAERGAIEQVFSTIYDSSTSDDAKTGLVDDPTGLTQAYAAARSGPFAAATKDTKFVLKDLVFTSPTEAVLKYDITIPPGSGSQEVALNRFGKAKLVDGQWKATRATVCSDLALASASCDSPSGSLNTDVSSSSGGGVSVTPMIAPTTTAPAATKGE